MKNEKKTVRWNFLTVLFIVLDLVLVETNFDLKIFLRVGTAATCAGIFSNPFDVIKTRQQLQGELQKCAPNMKHPYSSSLWQAIKTIVRAEGIIGDYFRTHVNTNNLKLFKTFYFSKAWLGCKRVKAQAHLNLKFTTSSQLIYINHQLGLGPALAFQFVMNSTRLGLYETVDQLNWTRFSKTSKHSTVLSCIWGGICGVVGSVIRSGIRFFIARHCITIYFWSIRQ